MRRLLLFSFMALSLAAVFAFRFISAGAAKNCSGKSDTCFYAIKVPPDIDMPSTPHFDTLIVRSKDCSVQLLRLPGWGTITTYTLMESGMEKMRGNACGSTTFNAGSVGYIDITKLPAGKYSMGLTACGNGGSFGIEIR